jgi:hypothetical protein
MWAKGLCEREEHVLSWSLLGGSGCNGVRRWAAGDVRIGALIFDASTARPKCLVPIKVNRGTCGFNRRQQVCGCGASGPPGIKSRTVRVQQAVRA